MSRLPSEDQDWTPPRASESSKDRKCCETGERPIKQASRRIPAQSRYMKRITLAILIAAAAAAGAQAATIPTLTLLPVSGNVAGLPATAVGWGFTLTFSDPSDWVILTGSAFTGSPVYGTHGRRKTGVE